MTKKKEIKYLSAEDVALRYGRTVGWVQRCKMLPKRKAGKFLVFREDELERFESYRNNHPNIKGRGYHIPTKKSVMRRDVQSADIEFTEIAVKTHKS